MSSVQPARGFRDLDPTAKREKEDLLARIRATYRRYGFSEIETPVVEPLERLRSSEGGENIGMIFQIMRRGLESEDASKLKNLSELADLGLRYDLTVPLARFYASNRDQLPTVLRAIQIGPVWRAERPQKGRYRQFTQCDIDIIGEPSIFAEIELSLATLAALDAIGLQGGVIRLNDRRLLDAMLAAAGIPVDDRPRVLIVIDKLDKVGLEGVREALLGFLETDVSERLMSFLTGFADSEDVDIDQFLKHIPDVNEEAVADHRSVLGAVRSVRGRECIRFDPTLVRGLGYYTGPIFEIEHPLSKSSVAGGGRYDNMVGKFLGRPVPACGFSLGFDRILEITEVLQSDEKPRVALLYERGTDAMAMVQRQSELLAKGFSVCPVAMLPNKKRLFEELKTSGFTKFQRLSDTVDQLQSV